MQPDDAMRRLLFERARGRCECRLTLCTHAGRCQQKLTVDGKAEAWDLQYMGLSDDPRDIDNWLVLCPHCLQLWPDTDLPETPDSPAESAITGSSGPRIA
jgi:hypothetical protein